MSSSTKIDSILSTPSTGLLTLPFAGDFSSSAIEAMPSIEFMRIERIMVYAIVVDDVKLVAIVPTRYGHISARHAKLVHGELQKVRAMGFV